MDDIKNILQNKTSKQKAPAYQWQDLALKVIQELGVPDFKRGSVFKLCKEKNHAIINQALIDTRELCQGGQKWKYFFKILSPKK
ncbi:hypothetical protein CVU82_00420 [Candidatus Falkowbacteria bacterium HGW-Falkowbacteria-1]|jgi:hypothetical protein|uniref:Uncharacterized protein n=1 Tax=Candidatus Falkowbacteria bacterium HGW-Falkowbacteria-1 TaxID=2013768 RepID=A0A2N2EAF6_9BACT|nr:MAG: hypothetical protein CVU82_00420 [Candidatus Falkowbacteria bacterium HGW-Falkowbacteria-1]